MDWEENHDKVEADVEDSVGVYERFQVYAASFYFAGHLEPDEVDLRKNQSVK